MLELAICLAEVKWHNVLTKHGLLLEFAGDAIASAHGDVLWSDRFTRDETQLRLLTFDEVDHAQDVCNKQTLLIELSVIWVRNAPAARGSLYFDLELRMTALHQKVIAVVATNTRYVFDRVLLRLEVLPRQGNCSKFDSHVGLN